MPSTEAHLDTDRPIRYLTQLCKHAAAMGDGRHRPHMHRNSALTRREVEIRAEWTDERGRLTFTPWGQCTLTARPGTLSLRIDAPDEPGLRNIQDVLANDLRRFTRRQALTLTWQPVDP